MDLDYDPENLGGGFSPTPLKNMIVKMGIFSKIGVNIKHI